MSLKTLMRLILKIYFLTLNIKMNIKLCPSPRYFELSILNLKQAYLNISMLLIVSANFNHKLMVLFNLKYQL